MANGSQPPTLTKSSAVSIGLVLGILAVAWWLLDTAHSRWDTIRQEVTRQTSRLDSVLERLNSLEAADRRQEASLREIEVSVAKLQAVLEAKIQAALEAAKKNR